MSPTLRTATHSVPAAPLVRAVARRLAVWGGAAAAAVVASTTLLFGLLWALSIIE